MVKKSLLVILAVSVIILVVTLVKRVKKDFDKQAELFI